MAGVKGMFERQSRSPGYAEAVRARIRAGGITKRLEDHVLGKVEMSASQVSAALGLLRKVVPDISAVEHTGRDGGPIETTDVTDIEAARAVAFSMAQAAEAVRKAKRKAEAA